MELQSVIHQVSAQDRRCFRMELEDNIRLLLELIDAIRAESAQVGDDRLANFFAGLHGIVAAFASRRVSFQPTRPLGGEWPADDPI